MSTRKIHRYPGLKPFSAEESKLFYGRKKDIADLEKTIQIEKQLVLHSKSGLGKSSLLNAGLTPRLLKKKNLQVVQIRFSAYYKEGIGLRDTVSQLMKETLDSLEAPGGLSAAENTLWYTFKQCQLAAPKNSVFVLIFDQFEETFTYPTEEITAFKTQLANVLNNSMPRAFQEAMEKGIADNSLSDEDLRAISTPLEVKAIFAIRSDKISLMDELKDVIPDILSRTYNLKALSREQAEDAILNPAYQKGDQFVSRQFDFTDEALDAILEYLTDGGDHQVESFQLQIICQHVEHIVIKQDKKLIERSDLGEIADIFENYYESLISRLSNEEEKEKARLFIEEGLILEADEIRLSLHEGQIERDFNLSSELLQKLVETRLVRSVRSARGNIYELSHDTLIKPILKAKERRLLIKQREEIEARHQAEELEQKALVAKEQRRLIRIAAAAALTLIIGVFAQGKWSEYQQGQANAIKQQILIDSLLGAQSKSLEALQEIAQQDSAEGSEKLLEAIVEEKKKVDEEKKKVDEKLGEALPAQPKTPAPRTLNAIIGEMYDEDENTRKAATSELTRRLTYSGDQAQSTMGAILSYANSHLEGRDQGHWNVLFLLDEKFENEAFFKANVASIKKYVAAMDGKYGSRTQARIDRVKARVAKLEE